MGGRLCKFSVWLIEEFRIRNHSKRHVHSYDTCLCLCLGRKECLTPRRTAGLVLARKHPQPATHNHHDEDNNGEDRDHGDGDREPSILRPVPHAQYKSVLGAVYNLHTPTLANAGKR